MADCNSSSRSIRTGEDVLLSTPVRIVPGEAKPWVFHLVQSNNDIIEYGGEIPQERINLLLDKINNTFSGAVSQNAMGVDTKIRFKAALYDPSGNKLREPGINRIRIDEVSDAANDQYKTLLAEQKALWPHDKYLNVWLISDRNNEYTSFHSTISTQCIPRYVVLLSPQFLYTGCLFSRL